MGHETAQEYLARHNMRDDDEIAKFRVAYYLVLSGYVDMHEKQTCSRVMRGKSWRSMLEYQVKVAKLAIGGL